MHQTPAPTRPNARQTAPLRVSGLHLSPPRYLTNQAADSMLFLSKSRLFGILPTKFPEYPHRTCGSAYGGSWQSLRVEQHSFSATMISARGSACRLQRSGTRPLFKRLFFTPIMDG